MQGPLCELTILARLKLTVFFNKTSFELLGILKTDIIFFHPISLKTISYQIIDILQSSNVRKIFRWASLLALINTTSTMSWLFLIQVLFQHHYIKGHISVFSRGFIFFCCLEPNFLHGVSCPYCPEYWRVSSVIPQKN